MRHGTLKAAEYRRICRLLERAGLPMQAARFRQAAATPGPMGRDKKVHKGRLRLMLPRASATPWSAMILIHNFWAIP